MFVSNYVDLPQTIYIQINPYLFDSEIVTPKPPQPINCVFYNLNLINIFFIFVWLSVNLETRFKGVLYEGGKYFYESLGSLHFLRNEMLYCLFLTRFEVGRTDFDVSVWSLWWRKCKICCLNTFADKCKRTHESYWACWFIAMVPKKSVTIIRFNFIANYCYFKHGLSLLSIFYGLVRRFWLYITTYLAITCKC